jgi:hypothetical protein
MSKRQIYTCDWLPPDFGAVGQYAMLEAREWASGFAVTLIGLTSEARFARIGRAGGGGISRNRSGASA